MNAVRLHLHVLREFEHGDGYDVVEAENVTTKQNRRFIGGGTVEAYEDLVATLRMTAAPGDRVRITGGSWVSHWGRERTWTPELLQAAIQPYASLGVTWEDSCICFGRPALEVNHG